MGNIGLNYAGSHAEPYPWLKVGNVTFRGNQCDHINQGSAFSCKANSTCDGVVVENNVLTNYGKSWGASYVSSWSASNNTDEAACEETLKNSMPHGAGVPKTDSDIPWECTLVTGVDRQKCIDYINWNFF